MVSNLETKARPSSPERVEAERRKVLRELRRYYIEESQRDDTWGKYKFRMLKAGIEKAIGREITDPKHPIPDDYTGDGSFSTTYRADDGTNVTQTEYIPLDSLRRYRNMGKSFPALEAHSRAFDESHPENRWGRARHEAYLHYSNGSPMDTQASPGSNFRIGGLILYGRKELRVPVVPNRQAQPQQ